jgi:hypothetical protein
MATQAILPLTPVGTFGPEPVSFQEHRGVSNQLAGFGHKSAGESFGGRLAGYPKSANSLIILKLMMFSRNFFGKIDA